jgi:signal transduction histidine kinase
MIKPKLLTLGVIGFAILLTIGVASIWLVQQSRRDQEWVAHSLELEGRITQLQFLVQSVEGSQRSYLLTEDKEYADSFEQALAGIPPAIAEIAGRTTDNPSQQQAVAALKPLLDRLPNFRNAIQKFDGGDRVGALTVVQTGRGRELTGQIGDILDAMKAEEARLLTTRSGASRSTQLWLVAITIAGLLTIVALAAVGIVMVRRSTRTMLAMQQELARANEGLEGMVAERTAELQEANDEVQRYAYIVSHDLRSPLVNIMGFTSELEHLRDGMFERIEALRGQVPATAENSGPDSGDETLKADFSEALGFIKTSIDKMDRLIHAILTLARQGRREFKAERLDTTALLQGIADSLAHQAQERDAEIRIGALPPITSDRLALEQIFSNLLDNALKYLRNGVVGEIQVSGRATATGLLYEVRDNGRGVDPKDGARIFELFRRAGVQDRPGEGIGLAHVRALTRRLGGSITMESALGQGSVFRVTLPKTWKEMSRRATT